MFGNLLLLAQEKKMVLCKTFTTSVFIKFECYTHILGSFYYKLQYFFMNYYNL